MNKTCGNCANYNLERMCHTDVCGKCFIEGTNGKNGKPNKWKPLPMTNADHIRGMSDEELCEFILEIRDGDCLNDRCYAADPNKGCDYCTMEWLKAPYKEDEE